MDPQTLDLADGRRLAYHRTQGAAPGIVFLGGFRSDMTGTKAQHLEAFARDRGQAHLRFDYTGHGGSSGRFEDGAIGDWTRDAADAVTRLTAGPQVLVGSSMGGWIALRLALALPERVAGVVGISAAPDFTEDGMWARFDEAQRAALLAEGRIVLPSDYDTGPYIVTRRLIEDGRDCLVLRERLALACPLRLLHGTADTDVDASVALRLLSHARGPDIRLTLVKDADHRFNSLEALALITATVADLLAGAG